MLRPIERCMGQVGLGPIQINRTIPSGKSPCRICNSMCFFEKLQHGSSMPRHGSARVCIGVQYVSCASPDFFMEPPRQRYKKSVACLRMPCRCLNIPRRAYCQSLVRLDIKAGRNLCANCAGCGYDTQVCGIGADACLGGRVGLTFADDGIEPLS